MECTVRSEYTLIQDITNWDSIAGTQNKHWQKLEKKTCSTINGMTSDNQTC